MTQRFQVQAIPGGTATGDSGTRDEVGWYDGGSWHGNLRESDGLKPQPRQYIDIAQAPDRVKEIHETVLPHYRHLHAHRLRTPATAAAE